jgi:hypothetical protein
MSSDSFQPPQLKGEIMDLEFTVDTDHRKRNATEQLSHVLIATHQSARFSPTLSQHSNL